MEAGSRCRGPRALPGGLLARTGLLCLLWTPWALGGGVGGAAAQAAGAEEPGGRTAGQGTDDRRSGSLVVAVADDRGVPVEDVRVWAVRDDSDSIALPESAAGVYRRASVPPGLYRVRAAKLGHRAAGGSARVRIGEGTLLRLVLVREPVPLEGLHARAEAGSRFERPGRAVDHVRFHGDGGDPPSLGAWLATLKGVSVRRRGAGGREVVGVRGSRPEGVRVLLDGLPVNDPLTGVADLSRIPVSTLESATLVRGASPSAGSGALAATLVLRSARERGDGAKVGMEVGSFGERAVDVRTSLVGKGGSLSVAGRLEGARNDYGFRNRVAPGRPTEERRNADVAARHLAISAEPAGGTLRLRARFDETERGTPGRMGTHLFDEARWEERSLQSSVVAEPARGLELGAAVQGFRTRYADPRRGVDDRRTGGTARLRARALTGSGWELSGRVSREWVAGDGIAGEAARLRGGAVLARTLRVGDRVRIRAALSADASTSRLVWSPEVAAEADLVGGLRLWGRAGRAFRSPGLADLYLAPAYGVAPTPDLRPERVTLDLEAGAEWRDGGGTVRIRTTAFRRTATDPIFWLAESAALWRPRNADGLVAGGVESELVWRPRRDLEVRAGATIQESRVRVGGEENPLPYAPTVEGSASAAWRWEAGSLRAEWHMTGSRPTRLAGTRRLPAFALLDVTARHTVRLGAVPVELGLGLHNLTDVRYELVELFPEPGREVELRVGFGPFPGGEEP